LDDKLALHLCFLFLLKRNMPMRFETSGQGSKNRIFTPFGDFYIDVENLFDQVMGNNQTSGNRQSEQDSAGKSVFRPTANVLESEAAFTVALDLPGVDADDVVIELLDGELRVAGVREIADVVAGTRVIEESRVHGDFERTFSFASQVNEDAIEASCENGVLKIVIPKAEKPVARKIKIKTRI
jgi:HSP20 family protein